ncbi:MAG TPA: flagellar export protein FliJ [Solirubrobacteraceae bacterium]|nr:flagellar export protein FliJ [Solirubrobacteraceae bacterium]
MNGQSFRFRLERVRALRERREDAAKQELAGAMMRHRRCEDEVEAAAARLAGARAAQVDATRVTSSATDMLARQAYLERAERAHQATRQDLQRQELELAQRREALVHAARDRQALERLKEHRRADHEREVARREGQVLDEIAINGFRRRAA